MNSGKTVFAQLMSFLPWYEFDKCVQRYNGNYKVQHFNCRQQLMVMMFAQMTNKESLRDIEACLNAIPEKLYHAGFRSLIKRSTLADANESRDWRIFADFAQVLIPEARALYKTDNNFNVDIDNMAYALDSTSIELCLSLFPWAKFRKHKGAVKAHTLIDLRGSIPTFIKLTDGLCHDVNVLDDLEYEPGAFYVMDRGYLDFSRLHTISQHSAFFVIRGKSNLKFRRIYSHQIDRSTGLICDQSIMLTGFYQKKDYPDKLRRIKYYDAKNDRTFVFLSNNFSLPAITIAELYKQRWQVELFFKWIKQNLRIKTFYGTSENAVKAQIWIAVSVYLLVAIMKKRLKIEASLYTILQVLSVTIFERMPLLQALTKEDYKTKVEPKSKQLLLFD